MSSTTAEILPIIMIDKKPIGTGLPGSWTEKLQLAFEATITKPVYV